MEKSAPIIPKISKALFIGSSTYMDDSKALPQAKQDVKEIIKFFKKHMDGFDRIQMVDKKAEDIDKVFNDDFLTCAKNSKDF